MMRAVLVLVAVLAMLRTGPGAAQDLVTDISRHLISIESNFTGAELLLFGAVEGERLSEEIDIAIVLRGPTDDLVVRRKARIGGIWINFDSADVASAPGYYAVVSTRPLAQIAPTSVLRRHGIGVENLNLPVTVDDPEKAEMFRNAVTRIRTGSSLYRSDDSGVVFLGNTLFRATIEVPANVPDGVFSSSVYMFQGGDLVHAQTTPVYVSKAGFERLVYDLARRQPLAYGILAVVLAVFAGWAASVAFRNG